MSILFISCSVRNARVNSQEEASSKGSVLTTNSVSEYLDESLPFALNSMESVLEAVPDHQGLLVATAAQFVLHGHTKILRSTEHRSFTDEQARRKRLHMAKSVFLRARAYGMRALAESQQGFQEAVERDLRQALARVTIQEAPALYWTGMALRAAISVDPDDHALLAERPIAEGFLSRAGELDESFKHRSLPDYLSFGQTERDFKSQQHLIETIDHNEPPRVVGGTE